MLLPLAVLLACSTPPTPPPPATSPETSADPAPPPELKVGDAMPVVNLRLHDGTMIPIQSLAGQKLLVYFYPKDDTSGCTVEAQGLRDGWADITAAGLKVYGVSLQDEASHRAFIEKNELPFPLVADTDGAVARAFKVPVNGEFAARQSFLIGTDGRIHQIWRDVDPQAHAAEVIAASRSL